MRISEVHFRDKVPTGHPGDMTVRLHSAEGPNATAGWSLEFAAGMLTATKGAQELIIPVGNIVYMRPEPTPPKLKAA